MGIRETLNQNRGITIGAVSGIIVLALGYVAYSVFSGTAGQGVIGGGEPKNFFSDDDGASYFLDGATKIPPFDHNGKQAVRAYVFTCDQGKTKFVGYLERYTAQAKSAMEQAIKNKTPGPAMSPEMLGAAMEIKPPKSGEQGWVKVVDPRAATIRAVRCPKNPRQDAEPVFPD